MKGALKKSINDAVEQMINQHTVSEQSKSTLQVRDKDLL